jgi:hypothetical protein
MKTLKRTLVALAALTVASMSVSTMAFASEDATPAGDEEKTTESVSESVSESESESESESVSDTTAEDTTEAASEADVQNKGDANASTVFTIGTVTVEPGTTTVDVPVTVSPNAGIAGTGLHYYYDGITFSKTVRGDVDPGFIGNASNASDVAVTTAADSAVSDTGVLYYLEFTIPADATAGTVYDIAGSLELVSDIDGNDLAAGMVDGAIIIAGAEESTEAASETETATEKATAAATKTVTKVGSSPATGEALPIAGAVAAVAVIGGVAIASKKRK